MAAAEATGRLKVITVTVPIETFIAFLEALPPEERFAHRDAPAPSLCLFTLGGVEVVIVQED